MCWVPSFSTPFMQDCKHAICMPCKHVIQDRAGQNYNQRRCTCCSLSLHRTLYPNHKNKKRATSTQSLRNETFPSVPGTFNLMSNSNLMYVCLFLVYFVFFFLLLLSYCLQHLDSNKNVMVQIILIIWNNPSWSSQIVTSVKSKLHHIIYSEAQTSGPKSG